MDRVETMSRVLNRLLDPLRRRLRLLAVRAVLMLADDSTKVQHVQAEALKGETMSQRERFQHYGFTSVPLEGAEMIGVAIGGVRGHTVWIADDDGRYRKKDLQPGDVALYTSQGVFIWLKDAAKAVQVHAGMEVDVDAPNVTVTAATKVKLDTPNVEITGNLTVDKKLTVQSSASFAGAGKNVTVAATMNLLVVTPGTLKIAGVPVVAP